MDEKARATHFLRWLTGADLDAQRVVDSTRSNPDFTAEDLGGKRYVLELTRLLPSQLRELEHFLRQHVCELVRAKIPEATNDTYILAAPFADIGGARVPRLVAQRLVNEIIEILKQPHSGAETWRLSAGFSLTRLTVGSGGITPWITGVSLADDSSADPDRVAALYAEFKKIVRECEAKFEGWTGHRVVLIDIAQSGLDSETACSRSKDGEGILLRWARELLVQSPVIDSVHIEPGTAVWHGSDLRMVLAGHRYVDEPSGAYIRLWPQAIDPG